MSTSPPTTDIKYVTPETISETRHLLEDYGSSSTIVAGGQSILSSGGGHLEGTTLFVDISALQELSGIEIGDDRIELGATTTYAQLEASQLCSTYPFLAEAVSRIADRQVRNMGTIGGAISQPEQSYDILSPLLCLNTTVTVTNPDQTRAIPLVEYLQTRLETGAKTELIESIAFDRPSAPRIGCAYKKHALLENGSTIVSVAALVALSEESTFDSVRVALTGGAETCIRVKAVESYLENRTADDTSIRSAADSLHDAIDPPADAKWSAAYKKHVAQTLAKRAIRAATRHAEGGRQ